MSQSVWVSSVIGLCLQLTAMPIVVTHLTMTAVQAESFPAEVREGYTLLGRGWVKDAIAAFRRAVQRYPESSEAKLGLAIAFRRNGQNEEAFRTYEQVVAQDPNNQLALRSLGLLGGYRPEWQARGIAALTTLLAINPNDADARAQRALLYGYQGRFAEALADYQVALQANPTPEIILGAAQVYTYNGNYSQGLELFNRYSQTGKPIQGYAALAYARALRGTGSKAQAITLLEAQLTKSTQLDELNTQLRVELSQAYLANQQATQALAILDPLRDRPDARLQLARALSEIGRQTNRAALTTEAAGLYRQVLSQTSDPSPVLLREVADVLSSQPQEQEYALQLYRQLAQADPSDKALQLKRLALENQLGYVSRAELRQSVRSLVQPLPSDPAQQQAIAQALVRIDPDPELRSVYEELLRSSAAANEPFLNFRLAQIDVQRNQLVEARNALAAYTATPQSSGDLAPQLLAAEIERREGNLDAAARRYEAIIATNPADPDVMLGALRGLAGVRLNQGRAGDALKLYDQMLAARPNDGLIQLGRTSIAYQAKQISVAEAEAVLTNWVSTRPATDTPPELFSLVGALPPDPRRESLYTSLAAADPTYIPVQLRLVQVLADRDPATARAKVAEIIARSRALGERPSAETSLLQAQLAQAIGDTRLASSAYQSVLQQQPDNTDALVGLGGIRFQQRQYSEAEQLYNQAIALNPNDTGVRRALIDLTVAQDRPLAAIAQLEQLQLQQVAGTEDASLAQRRQKIEEDFLQRRGFQPTWERY